MRKTSPKPRRPAWLYPEGTKITLKDGRVFSVVREVFVFWVDESSGHGGGRFQMLSSRRQWMESPGD